jgi:hypothetical protein
MGEPLSQCFAFQQFNFENSEEMTSEKVRRATADGPSRVSTDAFGPYVAAIDAGLHDRASHSQ